MTLALAGIGLKPVAQASFERNIVDVAGAVKTLVEAMPEYIEQAGSDEACAAFIRQARKAGFGGTFYNVSFVGTKTLSNELGKEAAGAVVCQVMPSPYKAAKPITREFTEAINFGCEDVQANFSNTANHIAARVFVEGLKRAGSKLTRESLITGLDFIADQSLGGFQVNFGPNDHVASSFVEMSLLTGDGRIRT